MTTMIALFWCGSIIVAVLVSYNYGYIAGKVDRGLEEIEAIKRAPRLPEPDPEPEPVSNVMDPDSPEWIAQQVREEHEAKMKRLNPDE